MSKSKQVLPSTKSLRERAAEAQDKRDKACQGLIGELDAVTALTKRLQHPTEEVEKVSVPDDGAE